MWEAAAGFEGTHTPPPPAEAGTPLVEAGDTPPAEADTPPVEAADTPPAAAHTPPAAVGTPLVAADNPPVAAAESPASAIARALGLGPQQKSSKRQTGGI